MQDDSLKRLEEIVDDQGDNPTVDALIALNEARWLKEVKRIVAARRLNRLL